MKKFKVKIDNIVHPKYRVTGLIVLETPKTSPYIFGQNYKMLIKLGYLMHGTILRVYGIYNKQNTKNGSGWVTMRHNKFPSLCKKHYPNDWEKICKG